MSRDTMSRREMMKGATKLGLLGAATSPGWKLGWEVAEKLDAEHDARRALVERKEEYINEIGDFTDDGLFNKNRSYDHSVTRFDSFGEVFSFDNGYWTDWTNVELHDTGDGFGDADTWNIVTKLKLHGNYGVLRDMEETGYLDELVEEELSAPMGKMYLAAKDHFHEVDTTNPSVEPTDEQVNRYTWRFDGNDERALMFSLDSEQMYSMDSAEEFREYIEDPDNYEVVSLNEDAWYDPRSYI